MASDPRGISGVRSSSFQFLRGSSVGELDETMGLIRPGATSDGSQPPALDDDRIVLFSCPEMESLRREILGIKGINEYVKPGEISWKRFEDGFPNLFIEDVNQIRGKHVAFIVGFLDHQMLLSQLGILFALPRYLARSLTVLLPYFPTGTMERVEKEGQIATAATFCRILSSVPLAANGPAKIVIFDIHALAERFYFGDSIVPVLLSATPLIVHVLNTRYKNDSIAICFPDEGSHKRFGNHFKQWEPIICAKVRDGDRRIITLMEGNPKDKHVFIIDDLVKTGGTLIECKDAMLARGAKEVSAYVTHGVFPEESWKRFTNAKPGTVNFSKFFITNSCASMADLLHDKAPFEVLSLGQMCVDILLRYT